MVNHSTAFNIALAAGWTEYFIEWLYFPSMKGNSFIYIIGFMTAMAGQFIRTVAMLTAGHNFSHYIAEKKEEGHVLISHGGVSSHNATTTTTTNTQKSSNEYESPNSHSEETHPGAARHDIGQQQS